MKMNLLHMNMYDVRETLYIVQAYIKFSAFSFLLSPYSFHPLHIKSCVAFHVSHVLQFYV